MCEPISMGIAMGGMQAMSSYSGQKQSARAQARSQAAASKQERERLGYEASSIRRQQQQDMISKTQRLQAAQQKSRAAQARSRVMAGENGVSGLSVNNVMNEIIRKEAAYNFSESKNEDMKDINTNMQLQEAAMRYRGNHLRINKPIQQPDLFGSLIGGASTGIGVATGLKSAGF